MYRVNISNKADRDMAVCISAGRGEKLAKIMATLEEAPFEHSQGFERLTGNMRGYCSRQIDIHNRVIYTVLPNINGERNNDGNLYKGIVCVYCAWGHDYTPPSGRLPS